MTKRGQPTKYQVTYVKQVYEFCLLGCTNEEMAEAFDVHIDTFYEWQKIHPDFSESIKKGKVRADAKVANATLKNALSGNAVSQIFWLKNRHPDKWRDKQKEEGTADSVILQIQKAVIPEDD